MNRVIQVVGLGLLAVAGVVVYFFFTPEENIREASSPPPVQRFTEIKTGFEHEPHAERFPFTGGAALDADNDGLTDIFISASKGQPSALLSFKDGRLTDRAQAFGLDIDEATFGATSLDMDNDGDTDLVVAQHDGVWIYTNLGGAFRGDKVGYTAPANSFPLNVCVADINEDGLADLYVSHFVVSSHFVSSAFNNPEHAKKNVMLLNMGGGEFKDVTEQTGTAGVQNTFHSTFVDLDDDGRQDLILANNTGPVEIFKNNGNLEFIPLNIESGMGYWMGLGVGDFDKDGDQDLYFSNIGASIPKSIVRGDLRDEQPLELEALLLRNDGSMNFTDVTSQYELDGYGFGWGAVFEDLNLDGELDMILGQNYIKWPVHKVKKLSNKAFLQLEQDGKKAFYHMDELGLNNPHFGQSALIADINDDGKPDVVWLNMGGPARAFLNTSTNNFLKVKVPDSIHYLGAKLVLETSSGDSYTRYVTANVGFTTDQTANVFFGLGRNNSAVKLLVTTTDGKTQTIRGLEANSTVNLQ